MIPFLGATPSQANATSSQAFDPLRLLLPGTTATVQVAMSQDNKFAGIMYQGVFYPASLPDNVKLGELLKVLIQVEADLMLLKILSENQEAPNTQRKTSEKQEILKPEEKRILKEALKLEREQSQQFSSEIKEAIKVNPKEIKEQIKVFFDSQDKALPLKEVSKLSQSPGVNTQKVISPQNQVITPNEVINLKTQTSAENITLKAKQAFEKLITSLVESVVMLGDKNEAISPEGIKIFSKSIAQSADVVKLLQELPDEEIYKLIKNVLKKLGSFETAQSPLPKLSAENEIVNEKGAKAQPEQLIPQKHSKIDLTKLDKALTPVKLENSFAIPPVIKESIQTVIQQFLKTTEIIEKIHTETPHLPQSVYFAIPFAQPLGNHSVEFLLTREREKKEKNRKKKRSSRSQIKLSLPLLGEINVEFLTINDEAHIKIIAESEETREKLSEHRYLIQKVFLELGLTVPSLFIECKKLGSIKPVWLKEQLGVETLA